MPSFKGIFLILMLVLMQSRRLNSLLTDKYLTHHWPIFDSNMSDVVGRADIERVSPIKFATDRFGNPNSSLNLMEESLKFQAVFISIRVNSLFQFGSIPRVLNTIQES